jgi:hypothetical protein
VFRFLQILRLLGPSWAFFRFKHVLRLKTGYFLKKTPQKAWGQKVPDIKARLWDVGFSKGLAERVQDIVSGRYLFFFRHEIEAGLIPDWFANPFARGVDTHGLQGAHWSKISDFGAGDIKGVWELSRFGWVYPLLAGFQQSGDENFVETFWDLIEDWAGHNPPHSGVHWKCGQEIAIRCFALTCAFYVLHSASASTKERLELIREILFESGKRIEANIDYALSQKNNHGISEAAGLFTLGLLFGDTNWRRQGQCLLESQALELIYKDGSFSQHSVNYHRVMLHVYLWAIRIGRSNGIEFSSELLSRVRQAGIWLSAICDRETGRCPNLGSNDGALVFPVSGCDYLDYRPTIQAVGAIIDGKDWLSHGEWDELAEFLGRGEERGKGEGLRVKERRDDGERRADATEGDACSSAFIRSLGGFLTPQASSPLPLAQKSLTFYEDGGYTVFQRARSKLLFRCPKSFRHRPGQCDLLHVDLFHDGINVLRDGGTFSYNCEQPWQDYFKSIAAHNTVQFDDHDQMPRLSRFLYGKWPKSEVIVDEAIPMVKAGFMDWKGCRHERSVEACEKGFRIVDRISGFKKKAVLRWRLAPELEWVLDGSRCSSEFVNLIVTSESNLPSVTIIEGWESLYYLERTTIPVWEIEVGPEGQELITEIEIL